MARRPAAFRPTGDKDSDKDFGVTPFTAAMTSVALLHGFAWAAASAQTVPVGGGPPLNGASVLPDSLLADARGAADMRVIEQAATIAHTSTVEGNMINGDISTGMVSIGNGAIDNFNGLALFSINTGNNVAINSSMTVNVAIQP